MKPQKVAIDDARKETLLDYVDGFPLRWQLLFAGQFLFILKSFGELPRVEWKFVIVTWIGGCLLTLGTAAYKKWKAEELCLPKAPDMPRIPPPPDPKGNK